MSKLYSKISTLLKNSNNNVKGRIAKHLNSLGAFAAGMIKTGQSSLSALGSGLPQDIYNESGETAAKRFVTGKWIDETTLYLPFLYAFLRAIFVITDLSKGIVLVIDGTQLGKDHAALLVSLVWQKRSIPLCWYVKAGSKGHFKTEDHITVLEKAKTVIKAIVPDDMQVTLLGDGEFDGIPLQEFCINTGWNYVFRTACDTILYEDGSRFQAKTVSPDKRHNVFYIPNVEFTLQRFQYVNFVCWHDEGKHEKPIYLVSNLSCPHDIIDYYSLRYAIECLFKDLKSTAFNIHKTRLRSTGAIHNLILIAAVAFIVCAIIAIRYDTKEMRKKVQRYRENRKLCSFLTFGHQAILRFIDKELPFDIFLNFPNNLGKKIRIDT